MHGDIEATKQTFIEAGRLAMAAGDLYLREIASSQLAAVHLAQGKLHEAAIAYQSVIALGAANQDKILDLGQAYIGLGGIEREWNNLEAADHYITEGIRQGERSGNTGIVLFGYLSLAQLRYAQGNMDESRKLLDKVEQLLHKHTYPQLITSIVAAAERWASEQERPLPPGIGTRERESYFSMSNAKQTECDTLASRETLITMVEALSGALFFIDDTQTIVYANPQFVWIMRPDGLCDYCNQRWCDYTGMTFQQAQGERSWWTAKSARAPPLR